MFNSPEHVFLHNYIEDEAGKELTDSEVALLITGSPTAILLPSGARQHDVDLALSGPQPIPIANVTLTTEQVKLFGYFARDLRELAASPLRKDGPGSISSGGKLPPGESVIKTALSEDEIRSSITIWRRLYMEKEPANFVKAVAAFVEVIGDNPWGKWVDGVRKVYEAELNSIPDFRPFIPSGKCTFTVKRLIDVFLYTQFAHQPDERRQRQFEECLVEVGGKSGLLTWMFLSTVWQRSLEIGNAGRVIVGWFDHYCKHHNITPAVLDSIMPAHPGIGTLEKEADRRERILGEKIQGLATELWQQNGSPPSGAIHFLHQAHEQLTEALRPDRKARSPMKENP
jgi:hypothetical protein